MCTVTAVKVVEKYKPETVPLSPVVGKKKRNKGLDAMDSIEVSHPVKIFEVVYSSKDGIFANTLGNHTYGFEIEALGIFFGFAYGVEKNVDMVPILPSVDDSKWYVEPFEEEWNKDTYKLNVVADVYRNKYFGRGVFFCVVLI